MGGKPISDFWLRRGGGAVWTPSFLADILCEQPLKYDWKTGGHIGGSLI